MTQENVQSIDIHVFKAAKRKSSVSDPFVIIKNFIYQLFIFTKIKKTKLNCRSRHWNSLIQLHIMYRFKSSYGEQFFTKVELVNKL